MNYAQALKQLDKFINYEKRLTHKAEYDVENFKTFLATLNSPQFYGTTITVAGTKGKGSTTRYITNALVNLGFNVGSFYSPHIRDLRERIQFNNNRISKEDFSEIFTYIFNHLHGREQSYKTYFEILVTIAFIYFIRKNNDFNILEVGLGGRLDSTNVAPNKYAVITHIGLDHTDILGNTVEKIAYEKAGIIKPGGVVITGFQKSTVIDVIRKRANEIGAKIIIAEELVDNIQNNTGDGIIRWSFEGEKYTFHTKMKGLHQTENMILAFLTLRELKKDNLIPQCFDKTLFLGKPLSGRFEVREVHGHKFILDGAHNRDAMEMLVRNITEYFGNSSLDLIFTCMQNKDIDGMVKGLKNLHINRIFLDQLNNPREINIDALKTTFLKYGFENIFTENSRKFLSISKSDYIIITGSFYLVGKWELILDNLF